MTETVVLPYEREGMWLSMHDFHYACAYESLGSFRLAQSARLAKEAELSADLDSIPKEHRGSFIHHKTSGLRASSEQAYVSSILYACMAIEAFLNNYGVRRLGEGYFRRTLERLGITEKFSLVLLACHGILIAKNDPVTLSLRTMFDTRNQLVHPKAREFSYELLEQELKEPPMESRIATHFERMEAVIDRLCGLDSHIRRDFEFRKPNG